MITNINAVNSYGVSTSVGEYDNHKKRLRLYYARSRQKKVNEVELAEVKIPEGAIDIELVDLDNDSRYVSDVEAYKESDRVDGRVLVKLDNFTKTR